MFRFGVPPVAIDLITKIKGLEFQAAFQRADWFNITEDLKIRALAKHDLIKTKKAVGRYKDLDDIEKLSD